MTENTEDAGRVITATDNNPPEPLVPALPPVVSDEEIAAKLHAKEVEEAASDEAIAPRHYDHAAHFALQAQVDAFIHAAAIWSKKVPTIQTAEQAERLNDYLTGATRLKSAIETQRKLDKKPWDDRADQVQAVYAPLTRSMEVTQGWFKPLQTAWLLAARDRIAKEKSDKLAAAAAKQAEVDALAAQAAVHGDVRAQVEAEAMQKEVDKDIKQASRVVAPTIKSASGGGRSMGLRKVAFAEIKNQNAVYMQFREHPRVVEVLQSLADAEIRGGGTVMGAERRERESV